MVVSQQHPLPAVPIIAGHCISRQHTPKHGEDCTQALHEHLSRHTAEHVLEQPFAHKTVNAHSIFVVLINVNIPGGGRR